MRTLFFSVLVWAVVPSLTAQEPADTIPDAARFVEPEEQVFSVVEELPRFPGCEELGSVKEKYDCSKEKVKEFLDAELRWPGQDDIEGMAVVSFIVEKDGSLSDIKVVRDLGGGCAAECIRVVKLMPNWIPAKQDGQPVRVEYHLPIRFRLE